LSKGVIKQIRSKLFDVLYKHLLDPLEKKNIHYESKCWEKFAPNGDCSM